MTHQLVNEIATAVTLGDCAATAAWLDEYLRTANICAFVRAKAHFGAASEELQYEIGAALGWCEPGDKPCTVPAIILKDYVALMEAAEKAFAE